MSIIKMPQAVFGAHAGLQKIMASVGIGIIPTGVDMQTSPPTVTFSTSLDLENSNDPTPLIEVPNLYGPEGNAFSARAAFFGDGSIAQENPSFLDIYRKWQTIADEEIARAQLRRDSLSKASIRALAGLRVTELYRMDSETTDPDAKAELMFRAGFTLVAFRPPVTSAQREEVFGLFNNASKLITNPDAKALVAEVAAYMRIAYLNEHYEDDVSNGVIDLWQRAQSASNHGHHAARLFASLRWAFTPTGNIYHMYYLLRDQSNDNHVYAADNLVRAVWSQLKWYHLMTEQNAGPEVDASAIKKYVDLVRAAATIWKKDDARASHVEALEHIAQNLKLIAKHIDDEHEGTYGFDSSASVLETLMARFPVHKER